MNQTSQTGLSLADVAARLDESGIRWAVFAGAAAVAYGVDRAITDVDILVPSSEGERLAELFPEGEIERDEHGEVDGLRLDGFDIIAGLRLVDLDEQMAARLTQGQVGSVPVPLIPVEDNIALKATWGRGPEQGKHDWQDVEAMIAAVDRLDWGYLRWRLEQFHSQERAGRTLARLKAL
jgi:predicted nucleotidyltransferase